MRIIPAAAKYLDKSGMSAYEFVELAGRTCYKSTDSITEGSAVKFVQRLKESGHWAMLEHGQIYIGLSYDMLDSFIYELMNNDFTLIDENENSDDNIKRSSIPALKFFNITYMEEFLAEQVSKQLLSGSFRSFLSLYTIYNSDPEFYTAIGNVLYFLAESYPDLFEKPDKLEIDEGYDNFELIESDCIEQWIIDEYGDLAEKEKLDINSILKKHITHTVLFTCDRGVSHEFVRMRLCSFAQESTRYCNYSKDKFGNEITVIKPCFWDEDSEEYAIWKASCEESEKNYFELINKGAKAQEARSVLPNSLKTELIITTNEDEWQHIVNLRYHGTTGAPHPQMVESMTCIYDTLVQKSNGRIK